MLILTNIENNTGYIILNRPQALNALNLELIDKLTDVLQLWREDPEVAQVVISSNSRAFCAGGDLKVAYEAIINGDFQLAGEFFTKEYELNALIHHYPKPYTAMLNGITMGGGMGISINGSKRIVTANAILCMPETSIGFYPDAGSTYFLNRCPGAVGMFLGLTSYRMNAVDAMFSGLATDYEDTMPLGKSYLEENYAEINEHFGKESWAEIYESLNQANTPFAAATLEQLKLLSPNSLKVAFIMLYKARAMTFDQAIAAELAMSLEIIHHPDFREGIRAAVIDKDRQPRWVPVKI